MSEHILVGHFLTRAQASHRSGIPPDQLIARPDVIHIGGTWLEEVYFAFQFGEHALRPDLASAIRILHSRLDDESIADWLARPNEVLGLATPLTWSAMGHDARRLAAASREALAGANDA